jgi:ribosomal protein L32E
LTGQRQKIAIQFWLFEDERDRFKAKLEEDAVHIQEFLRHVVRRYIGLEEPWRESRA